MYDLGLTEGDLFPVTSTMTGANSSMMDVVGGMLNQLLFDNKFKIPIHMFSDSIPLLDTIASTGAIKHTYLAGEVRALKDFLRQGMVKSYSWIESGDIPADYLTKIMTENVQVRDIFFGVNFYMEKIGLMWFNTLRGL